MAGTGWPAAGGVRLATETGVKAGGLKPTGDVSGTRLLMLEKIINKINNKTTMPLHTSFFSLKNILSRPKKVFEGR